MVSTLVKCHDSDRGDLSVATLSNDDPQESRLLRNADWGDVLSIDFTAVANHSNLLHVCFGIGVDDVLLPPCTLVILKEAESATHAP